MTLQERNKYLTDLGFVFEEDKKQKLSISEMVELEDIIEQYTTEEIFNYVDQNDGKYEQKINYIAAASILPYDEIKERLVQYDKSFPKEDEIKMVSELCNKYHQSKKIILQRIREIRKMEAFKKT